jgi:hypothetical protein
VAADSDQGDAVTAPARAFFENVERDGRRLL